MSAPEILNPYSDSERVSCLLMESNPEPAMPLRQEPLLPAASQSRSRASLERVVDATITLLTERGDGDFTIAEVSAYAGVAVGTVYGRVGNKESLLLAVHERELTRMDRETVARLSAATESGSTLRQAVGAVIAARTAMLAAEAPLLRALMRVAGDYPAISRRGRTSGLIAQSAFVETLTAVCRRFDVHVDGMDVEWADEVTYAVAARQLGIEVADRGAPMRDIPLEELTERLTATVTAYLSTIGR